MLPTEDTLTDFMLVSMFDVGKQTPRPTLGTMGCPNNCCRPFIINVWAYANMFCWVGPPAAHKGTVPIFFTSLCHCQCQWKHGAGT
jgi:hypothetical protein